MDTSTRHALTTFSPKVKTALSALLEASDYAEDTDSDRWEFAVAIRCLEKMGLNETDLRWFVRKGLVEHAREVTIPGVNGRDFRPTGDLTFSKRTCFVLTHTGITTARSLFEQAPQSNSDQISPTQRSTSATSVVPDWDMATRELRLHGKIVKRFRWRAVNQEIVLAVFQEEGWPPRIDDPMPPQPEQDSKRRLSDTIKCLNRRQSNELIHFRGDGTGQGIIWEQVIQ